MLWHAKKRFYKIKNKEMQSVMNLLKRKTIRSLIIVFVFLLFLILIINKYYCQNVNHRLQWWLSEIEWDENRDNLSGKNVKIAIVDTGVDFTHKDLSRVKHSEINIMKKDKDELDHGTAIAGIIAGYPYGTNGILGIAPDTELLSINITNTEYVEEDNLIKGINLAIEKNVDIINISVGVKENNPELYECIKKAYEKNIIIVASAGNYMTDEILYPAAYDEVLAVGSYDKKNRIISPKNTLSNVIYLPGKNVVTCISEGKYAGVQGTSFSTAILSGIIALVKEDNPNITNEYINKKIKEVSGKQDVKLTVKKLLNVLEVSK